MLTVIIFRWKQNQTRFNQTRLFYEEGSWYDGQYWEKPLSLVKNDKLISTQKIEPVLQRLYKTYIILYFFEFIVLAFTTNLKKFLKNYYNIFNDSGVEQSGSSSGS